MEGRVDGWVATNDLAGGRWLQTKNHRRRIVSIHSLSEFAYVLRPGGLLYTITDVKELYQWHLRHLEAHPVRVPYQRRLGHLRPSNRPSPGQLGPRFLSHVGVGDRCE